MMKESRILSEKIFIGRVEREKTTILLAIKILISLFLLQCCISAVSAATIGFGETVSGTISTSGEKDSYTFTASAGDTVYTRMVSSWQQYPQIQLYDPYGTLIADANGISWRNSNTSHLDSTGTYTIIVGDGHIGSATGTYGLFLQRTNNSGNAPPIAFGETKNGTISTIGEMKSYNFTASAGDTVYTRMVSSWQQDPHIQLFAPNGTRIAEANGLSWMNSNTSRLDSTGTYTIIVGDGHIGSATGTYGLFLQRTNNSGNALPIAFGETKNGAISTMGEMKSFTFSAWNGDRISIHMTSSWQQDPHIQLFAPNGTRIAEANGLSWANSNTSLLESSGTYTIVIGDGHIGSDTGTYGLSLQFLGTLRTIANFSANITLVSPLTVQFTDSSTNSPTAWRGDFGDGNSSTQRHPSNSYGGPGLYSVTLTATNAYGSNSTIKTHYISATAGTMKPRLASTTVVTGIWITAETGSSYQQPVTDIFPTERADGHNSSVTGMATGRARSGSTRTASGTSIMAVVA